MKVAEIKTDVTGRDSIESGSLNPSRMMQVKPEKSLLDYCCISQQTEEIMPSMIYTSKGNYYDASNHAARQLNFCEKVQAGYPYEESKLGQKDVWMTEGRSTPFLVCNKDKVNYLIHYYIERGGDMSTYPFENDSERTKRAYQFNVTLQVNKALEESRLKHVFEEAGVSEGTIAVDAKGEVSIETDVEVSFEKKESMKKQLMERGWTDTALRNMVFSQCSGFAGLSIEEKNEASSMYNVGWILYRYYSVRIEDLSMAEDGSISGLPDEVYEKHDYQSQPDFYDNIRKLIRRGGKSEDEIGRIVYRNGKLFVL